VAPGTVALTLSLPKLGGPFGSIVAAKRHSATVSVPELVGRTYAQAMKTIGTAFETGLWLRVASAAPLSASSAGLAAFRVVSQSPRAGTRVDYEGELPGRPGVRAARSTVTVRLGTGGTTTAAQASRRAARALRAAAPTGRSLGPFSATATAGTCRIARGGPARVFIPGRCFTGVDLSGRNPAVVYRQLWDGRDFRGDGAPARPGLEHVWAVTVSPAGKVLSVRSSGAFPPELAC
jgi:hypothetical protein